MAMYIDADKLIEHIKDLPTWREVLGRGWLATKYPDGTFDCEDVINSIVNVPTADVAEVVRCEKCKHWHNKVFDPIIEKHIGECHCPQWENDYFWYETSENDFCSNGKKEQE